MILAVMKTLSAVAAMLGLCACETFAPPPEPAVRKAQPIAKIDVRSIPTGCVVDRVSGACSS